MGFNWYKYLIRFSCNSCQMQNKTNKNQNQASWTKRMSSYGKEDQEEKSN